MKEENPKRKAGTGTVGPDGRVIPETKTRRRKKKAHGSKWLNRLLCLGCLSCLVPLWWEWRGRHDALPQPLKNDPWVRVIDAAPPDEVLSDGARSAQKRWRGHARHGRQKYSVSADGTVPQDKNDELEAKLAALGKDEAGGAEAAMAAAEVRAAAAANLSKQGRLPVESVEQQPTRTAAAGEPPNDAAGTGTAIKGVDTAAAPAAPAASAASAAAEEDPALAELRAVDAATAPNRTATAGGAGGVGGAEPKRAHRMWKVVPGGVHDIVEGEGSDAKTFSVVGIPAPKVANGSFVTDMTDGALGLTEFELGLLNRNMSALARLSPYRLVLALLPSLPKEVNARRLYGSQLLRSWYGMSRLNERSVVILMALDGSVEIVAGKLCRVVLSDAVARHFSIKAMELISKEPTAAEAAEEALPGARPHTASRITDTALKLVFYTAFSIRQRAQLTAMSMRSVSMFMMLFMLMTVSATKQQQARRYAELYHYGYRNGHYPSGLGYGGARRAMHEDMFWEQFESGRRGESRWDRDASESRTDAFFRLQVLTMLLSRAGTVDEEEEEYEEEEEENEDEVETLLFLEGHERNRSWR